MDEDEPEVFQAPADWNGKCVYCGEDELEGGLNGGRCMYCGSITIPPDTKDHCEKCGCALNSEAALIEERGEVWCHSCADNAADHDGNEHVATQDSYEWKVA